MFTLPAPLVYNCGGYESLATLAALEGVVQIYMPDFKYGEDGPGLRLSGVPDYAARARQALAEMHRQVGDLRLDREGVARAGLLVRHLVLPRGLAGSAGVFSFLARRVSPDTYLNVMDQYRPCAGARQDPELDRHLTHAEWAEALGLARAAGLRRLD